MQLTYFIDFEEVFFEWVKTFEVVRCVHRYVLLKSDMRIIFNAYLKQ